MLKQYNTMRVPDKYEDIMDALDFKSFALEKSSADRNPTGNVIIQPLILRVQSECDLELNLWYAGDGTLGGSIA
jgi:hypothetical protein